MNREEVVASVAELQALVTGDGAALELVDVDGPNRSVTLGLVLDGVECIECVMPRDYLEALSLDILRRTLPDLTRVSVEDPREGAAPPVGH